MMRLPSLPIRWPANGALAVVCALLLIGPPLWAEGDAFQVVQQWTASDGLPAETVDGLAIDRDGQLWMATYDGVVRYQGYDFRHFNRHSQPALPSNRGLAVHAAPDGGIYLQFEDGQLGHLDETAYTPVGRASLNGWTVFAGRIWFIDGDTGGLWSWHQAYGAQRWTESGLKSLALDPFDQRLLLGTDSGDVLSLLDPPAALLKIASSGAEPVLGLAAGPKGEILVLQPRGARLLGPEQSANPDEFLVHWPRGQTRLMLATWTERGWLLGNLFSERGGGPNLIEGSRLRTLDVSAATGIDADRSPAVIERRDSDGGRWINDGQQLFREGLPMFRSKERIRNFIIDDFGQVWITQPAQGLRLLKQGVIGTLGTSADELPDPNISLVKELDGHLLIGSWVALSRLDPSTGVWTQLLQGAARDVLSDGDGLLVGGHGLCRLARQGECVDVTDYPGGSAEIRLLHRDRGGAVWAGSESGLFRRSAEGSWQPAPLYPAVVRTALEDQEARLIFGTNGHGLLTLSTDAGPEWGINRVGTEHGLSSEFVRSLLAVPGGMLVGTEDAGLCLLGPQLEVSGCLSSDGGLPHHSVHFMVVDEQQRMWVNTNAGIYRVELASLLAFLRGEQQQLPAFARFGKRQGMLSAEGNGGVYRAGAQTADGRLWFPNQMGLVAVRTDRDPLRPDLALRVQIRILEPLHEAGQPLRLARHARHLELELLATALAEPQNVQFRYRLGADSDWQALGRQRRLSFRELPPGRHVLEVMAHHADATSAGPPATLEFHADYRLHEHPAARGLVALLLLLGTMALWLLMRRRQQALELAVQERTSQLDQATDQIARLSRSMDQVDFKHRVALQAVSRELKGALAAALAPLREVNNDKRLTERWAQQTRVRTNTLDGLIEQLDRFGEAAPESQGANVFEPGMAADQLAPDQNERMPSKLGPVPDLESRIRMEVLLHLGEPNFAVDDLAKRLGMSRSALYRRVAEFHSGKPAELIRAMRLDQAARLLSETDQQISTIASATGFRSISSFSRAFAARTGMSPRQWRTRNLSEAIPEAGS